VELPNQNVVGSEDEVVAIAGVALANGHGVGGRRRKKGERGGDLVSAAAFSTGERLRVLLAALKEGGAEDLEIGTEQFLPDSGDGVEAGE
jgi:hypothetical protein